MKFSPAQWCMAALAALLLHGAAAMALGLGREPEALPPAGGLDLAVTDLVDLAELFGAATEVSPVIEAVEAVAPAEPVAAPQVVDTAAPADAGELAAEAVEPVPPPTEDVAPPEEVAAVVEPVRQEPAVRPQASPERQKQTPRKKKAPASPQPRAAAPAKPSPVVPATPAGGGGSAAGKSQRPAAISGAALGNYKGRVLAHLARHKRYPAEARRARLRGSVLVAFSIDNAGRVLSVRLAKASGHPPLDAEATAMVRRASPFPAIPAGASKKSMSFTTRVEFK